MSTATEPTRTPDSPAQAATGFRRVGRPVEGEATNRAIMIADLAGVPLYVVHLELIAA
jgi:dihydroorotase-like cyclic amidohydrolase